MKKVLVFLFACLASTTMFAAGEYFEVVPISSQPFYTKLPCVILIDGVEQYNTNLELGVFDDNDICRGTAIGAENPRTHRVFFNLRFKALAEGTEMHLKVYDHASGQILNLVPDLEEPITYQGNYTYPWNGSNAGAMNPFELNFISSASEGINLDITGYGEGEGHWYLISSPVGEVDPLQVRGLVYEESEEDKFDLYYFDQSADNSVPDYLEWINYKQDPSAFGDLLVGKGYLFASKRDTTLFFPGTAYTGSGEVSLARSDADSVEFAGWNLVGNPYNEVAYIEDNRSFYRMNATNDDLITEAVTGAIQPMEGVFVYTENDGDVINFTTNAPNKVSRLALNLSSNSKVIDRAVVGFDGNSNLPKFQLNPNHTKVYIPQEGKDYAVVSAGEMGEMPVNFKAEKTGNYSLTFTAQEVSFAYLHLIDNMTGADVDLLETPSYSFDARTTDYASRFKLVFATGNSTGDDFAFFSNGNFVINNEGNATLQVIDVNGRIVKSESINGCASVNVNAASGVYMLRLVNGNDMKVQKVVVK